MRYTTIEQALEALEIAEQDCIADFGEELADQAHSDLVRNVAMDSTPEVSAELFQREGVQPPIRGSFNFS